MPKYFLTHPSNSGWYYRKRCGEEERVLGDQTQGVEAPNYSDRKGIFNRYKAHETWNCNELIRITPYKLNETLC